MKRLVILAAVLVALPAAEAAYKCTDEKGRTHIGDPPPPRCERVIMYEISRSGTVLRKIDPTPTEQERQARADEMARKKEEARAADEQRRKDLALLATYSSERDFDVSRDRNIEPVQNRIKGARERYEAVEKRLRELEEETEFYKAGKSKAAASKAAAGKAREVPAQLAADLDRTRREKEQLNANLAGYDREIEQIRVRYEADKKRWMDLKQMHREGRLDLRDPREIEAAASKKAPPTGQTKRYNLYLVPAN